MIEKALFILACYGIFFVSVLRYYRPKCQNIETDKNHCKNYRPGGNLTNQNCKKHNVKFDQIKDSDDCCFLPKFNEVAFRSIILRLGMGLLVAIGIIISII